MTENKNREDAFWKLISALEKANVLPHVMIIGTWAEWLYSDYFASLTDGKVFKVDIGKTHDMDVFFRNALLEIEGADKLQGYLKDAGFVPGHDYRGTFFMGGIEVEFLASQLGTGPGLVKIPSVGIKAERLKDLDMLDPLTVVSSGYAITIPTPASYVAHKLFINPERRPESKRTQDVRKVSVLLASMKDIPGQMDMLEQYLAELPNDKLERIRMVAQSNSISLPI